MTRFGVSLALLLILSVLPAPSHAARLKELVAIEGVRENQLIGYGLVVGLNGTGDKRQTIFSAQSLANLLQQMGVSVPGTALKVNNTAGVMITATLPAFAQPGTRIDVNAAAIGDATNLQGGLLLLASLKGVDGQVYAMAQGPVVTGGFVAGTGGNTSTLNHPTMGRVPAGAIIERPAPAIKISSAINLNLHRGDFTTAARIAEVINKWFSVGARVAAAENSSRVNVQIPPEFVGRSAEFIAQLETLAVVTDRVAKVIVNERTGTVTLGRDVVITPVAILHGGLTVEVQTSFDVSQPAPFSAGETTVVPRVGVGIKEDPARNVVLKPGATVEDLVKALSAIGATSRDVIAILQGLKSAGALEAELEVI
ncbi:MAG TPA: flagellar basal body P-ring protein FlgI [Bryobacteraceae bacterium]|nr:flagellar basal body P-ring protein FlgI [Bryobacteraceae bacterium]